MTTTSDVIGDTSGLTRHTVPFRAVHDLVGITGHGHFSLIAADGLRQFIGNHSSVKIIPTSVEARVYGPTAANKTIDVYVAILPENLVTWPTLPASIIRQATSTECSHSVYAPGKESKLRFAQDVAYQLKPEPLIGHQPTVAYVFNTVGADALTINHLAISGEIDVQGIGFVTTW